VKALVIIVLVVLAVFLTLTLADRILAAAPMAVVPLAAAAGLLAAAAGDHLAAVLAAKAPVAVLVRKAEAEAEAAPAVVAAMVAAAARKVTPDRAGLSSYPPQSPRDGLASSSVPSSRAGTSASPARPVDRQDPTYRDRPTSHPPISASPEDRVTAWEETTRSCAPSSGRGSKTASATGSTGKVNRNNTTAGEAAADDRG
jgi:hypothetical protein